MDLSKRVERARIQRRQLHDHQLSNITDAQRSAFTTQVRDLEEQARVAILNYLGREYETNGTNALEGLMNDYPDAIDPDDESIEAIEHRQLVAGLRHHVQEHCLVNGLAPMPVFDYTGKNDKVISRQEWTELVIFSKRMNELIAEDGSFSTLKCNGKKHCHRKWSHARTFSLENDKIVPLSDHAKLMRMRSEDCKALTKAERKIWILTCSDECNCSQTSCAQHSSFVKRSVPLCIFRHKDLGWSVRAIAPIERFTILAILGGEGFGCERKRHVKNRNEFVKAENSLAQYHSANVGNEFILFNHDCEPNCLTGNAVTNRTGFPRTFMVARRDISAGEELTISYFMDGIPPREQWAFECTCKKASCGYEQPERKKYGK